MAPSTQTSSNNPPNRRWRPSHNRQPKSKTTSIASTPTPTANPVKRAASTRIIQAQMERLNGPLTVSPTSSEIDVTLGSSTRPTVVNRAKQGQDKRRPPSARKGHMVSPSHTNTSITPEQPPTEAEKPHEVFANRKRPIKIVNPDDRESRGEIDVDTPTNSTSKAAKPTSVSSSVPSFFAHSPAKTSPTMPAFHGKQQRSPVTPPRFRGVSSGWASSASPYTAPHTAAHGAAHGVAHGASHSHAANATHSRKIVAEYGHPIVPFAHQDTRSVSAYAERQPIRSPELLRPAPRPIPALSSDDRRLRLYKLIPNLKTLQQSDYPPPEPYNAAFPHPISAYASPGVNVHSLAASGYLELLEDLVKNDPAKLKGSILASASEKEDLWPPALDMVLAGDDGCGIPERLFVQFDSLGAARISVGTPTPAPYARIKPLSGSPPLARSNMDGQATLGHSQDEFVVSHFTSRRPCFSDQHAWRRDSQVPPYSPLSVDRREIDPRGGLSSEFKTELCPVWEDTGICKYGKSCQFAHGFNELRTPTRIVPLPSPPLDQAPYYGKHLPEGSMPLTSSNRKASLPSLPVMPRLDIRRASAPPRNLSVVTELEDQPGLWQQEDIPPIGSERISPPRERSRTSLPDLCPSQGWQHIEFDCFANLTPRPQVRDLQHSISSVSSSNQSTSYTPISEYTSDKWSPNAQSSVQAGSHSSKGHNEHVESDATWSRTAATTTIDFSTGRSIWCSKAVTMS